MALSISLGVSITSDIVTASITDSTVYGSPNPTRASVRVFMTANKMNYTNEVAYPLVLTPNSTDPAVVTSWSWPYQSTDGWINFYFVIIQAVYNSGTSYAKYDAVYDGSNNVYRSLVTGNIGHALNNTTYWEIIASPSTLAANKGEANESLNIVSILYQRVLTYFSQKEYGSFVSIASEQCCGDCENAEANETYDLLSLLVNGAIQADLRTQPVQGETIARRLSGIFSTC